MVIDVPISEATERWLEAKARLAGVDVATYAARLLDMLAQSSQTLSEMSSSIADAFQQSGMSEDELSDFLEIEKHAQRRHARR